MTRRAYCTVHARCAVTVVRPGGLEDSPGSSRNTVPASRQARGPAAAPDDEVIRMRARVGDRLVVGEDRIGEVVGVPSADGSPPYIIKWLKDGHIAMVLPDQYSRIVPAGETVVTEAQGPRHDGRGAAPTTGSRPVPGPTRC